MSKSALEQVDAEIKRRRSEVSKLQARRHSAGKRTYTQSEMEKRYRTEK